MKKESIKSRHFPKVTAISVPYNIYQMKTSRSSLDRLLDPENGSLNLPTMERAAAALAKKVLLQLI